jgi:hypothetical protein
LALALESNGYNNFSGNLLAGTPASDKKYLLITGDNELSNKSYENYLKIESENSDGSKVKIIIGSESAAEGLDFKYIREVYILDPWHHLNKLDQVVGRAIRNCSHIQLPLEKRNVIVYYLAATKEDTSVETVDLKLYRQAEEKESVISKVSYFLKQNAVDCNLNKEGNVFIDKVYKKPIDIVTSRGTKHVITLEDKDKSRECQYMNSDYKCLNNIDTKPSKFDESTYNYDIMTDYYFDILDMMKDLLKKRVTINLKSIEKEFLKKYEKDYLDLLYITLDKLIENDEHLDNEGNIIRVKDNVYYKMHKSKKNMPVSLSNLAIKTKKKLRALNITSLKLGEARQNKNKKTQKVEPDSYHLTELEKLYISKKEIITEEKHFNPDKQSVLSELLNKYRDILLFSYYKNREGLIISAIKSKNERLLSICDSNLLYMKRDINPSHEGEDSIWGYKVIKNGELKYFKKDGKEVNDEELRKIKRVLLERFENEELPDKIIGYLEYKKDDLLFKVRDKVVEGKKGTQIKTGSVCGNEGMKKNKIIEFIDYLLGTKNHYGNEKKSIPSKPALCLEVELNLIDNDVIKKNDKRWYYNPEETLERGLNKKK